MSFSFEMLIDIFDQTANQLIERITDNEHVLLVAAISFSIYYSDGSHWVFVQYLCGKSVKAYRDCHM